MNRCNDDTSETKSTSSNDFFLRKRTLGVHHDLVRNLQGGTVQPGIELGAFLLERRNLIDLLQRQTNLVQTMLMQVLWEDPCVEDRCCVRSSKQKPNITAQPL